MKHVKGELREELHAKNTIVSNVSSLMVIPVVRTSSKKALSSVTTRLKQRFSHSILVAVAAVTP